MATRWRYAVVVTLCLVTLPLSTQAQETSLVPVLVDGETVRLAMRIYKPVAGNPAPTLVFNHGSTGMGTDPGLFSRPIDAPAAARFFVQRGWAVVMPARRGRGGSDGLYDEGFAADRPRGYTCDPAVSLAGANRALRDVEAAMAAILAMPFVDGSRVVIGGVSRGGILSVAYAGQHPERIYGDGDPFYPLSHSRDNFGAFQTAGGRGAFHEFVGGHQVSSHPDLWGHAVESYLRQRGLP